VAVCALEADLKQLTNGDMTIVGERGVSLSGGQKARVNLARALYQDANIYLLDDPISQVDTNVSRHIFEKCIQSHLKGNLRILVTHQLQYLPQADHVIVMNEVSNLYFNHKKEAQFICIIGQNFSSWILQ
jgi:ATP-binding cassette subfamily C (CFTR/MRP) protein 4